jgi:hypothetical protein
MQGRSESFMGEPMNFTSEPPRWLRFLGTPLPPIAKDPGPARRYFFVGGVAGSATGVNASFHLICCSYEGCIL